MEFKFLMFNSPWWLWPIPSSGQRWVVHRLCWRRLSSKSTLCIVDNCDRHGSTELPCISWPAKRNGRIKLELSLVGKESTSMDSPIAEQFSNQYRVPPDVRSIHATAEWPNACRNRWQSLCPRMLGLWHQRVPRMARHLEYHQPPNPPTMDWNDCDDCTSNASTNCTTISVSCQCYRRSNSLRWFSRRWIFWCIGNRHSRHPHPECSCRWCEKLGRHYGNGPTSRTIPMCRPRWQHLRRIWCQSPMYRSQSGSWSRNRKTKMIRRFAFWGYVRFICTKFIGIVPEIHCGQPNDGSRFRCGNEIQYLLLVQTNRRILKKKCHLRWSLCAIVAGIPHRIRCLTRKIVECTWLWSIIPQRLIEVWPVVEHFVDFRFRQINWKLNSRKWRIEWSRLPNFTYTIYSVQKLQVVCLTAPVNTLAESPYREPTFVFRTHNTRSHMYIIVAASAAVQQEMKQLDC